MTKPWAVFLVGFSAILAGQDTPRFSFEVASVKPMPEGSYGRGWGSTGIAPPIQGDPAEITLTDVSLVGILCRAYDLRPVDIHAPEWMESRRYSIVAKIPADAPKGHIAEMLQNLLADRFQMKLHWETKEESGYLLTLTGGDPKLKKSAPNAGRRIGMRLDGHFEWYAHTMTDLANSLTVMMGGPVVNRTDLAGSFDITVDAAPDSMPGFRFGRGGESALPTIFAALRQLGLKLEPAKKLPVKYLVIDSALKVPTEN